tara:strand:+ start:663 stop:1643 length:981 start_codon:yes stop_codon:yes gene_type:complete
MRVISFSKFGSPNVLEMTSRQIPKLSPNEILLKVIVAGVNRPDLLQREGKYLPPNDASDILGLEASGEVISKGTNVSKWSVGDKLTALLHGGGYADYVKVHEDHCLPIPKGLSVIEAAGLCENYFTVWANIFSKKIIKKNHNLLIHGGSSGIGIAAIQLAKNFGANVFTTVGNEKKKNFCKNLGAEIVINYNEEDFFKILKPISKERGLNIVLDMVGGSYINKNISLLSHDGYLIFIAFLQGSKVETDFVKIMLKRLLITGSTLRSRSVEFKAQIAREVKENVWPLLEQKSIIPVVDKIFNFNEVIEAHRYMESSQHIGKILINID